MIRKRSGKDPPPRNESSTISKLGRDPPTIKDSTCYPPQNFGGLETKQSIRRAPLGDKRQPTAANEASDDEDDDRSIFTLPSRLQRTQNVNLLSIEGEHLAVSNLKAHSEHQLGKLLNEKEMLENQLLETTRQVGDAKGQKEKLENRLLQSENDKEKMKEEINRLQLELSTKKKQSELAENTKQEELRSLQLQLSTMKIQAENAANEKDKVKAHLRRLHLELSAKKEQADLARH